MEDASNVPSQALVDEFAKSETETKQVLTGDALKNQPEETQQLTTADRRRMKAYQDQMKTMVKKFRRDQNRRDSKLAGELKAIKNSLGKETFQTLKDICTVKTPEVKDEAGVVTQKARVEVNTRALITEGKILIAMLRQERIDKKLRKATTGRSSRRAAHRGMIDFLKARNTSAKDEPVKKSVELK
jgi:hypothetical protein